MKVLPELQKKKIIALCSKMAYQDARLLYKSVITIHDKKGLGFIQYSNQGALEANCLIKGRYKCLTRLFVRITRISH